MKICNVCKTVLEDSAIYCPRCTSQSFSAFPTKICPFCNASVAVGTIVCSNCHKILPPEDFVRPASQPVVTATPFNGGNYQQSAANEFATPKQNFDNLHNFNSSERIVQVLPTERLENIAFDNGSLESENVNFGRPEQYADVHPIVAHPPIQNAYQNEQPNKDAKEAGFSESSARLSKKIDSEIAKKHKPLKNGKLVEDEILFEDRNKNFNDGAIVRSQAETNANDQIVKNAFADLNQQQNLVRQNEGGSQTFIYNQVYPMTQSNGQQTVGQSSQGYPQSNGQQTVGQSSQGYPQSNGQQTVGQSSQGYPQSNGQQTVGQSSLVKKDTHNLKKAKKLAEKQAKKQAEQQAKEQAKEQAKAKEIAMKNKARAGRKSRKRGGAAAALISIIFLVTGLAASLLLININFLNDKYSGLQLLVAYLPSQFSSLFPSTLLKIMDNGYLFGNELALFKIVPYIYMGAVGVTALSILSHIFCFRATSGRATYLAILGVFAFILSMSVIVIIFVLFNFSTIGYGIMFLAGSIILSLFTLAVGYRKKKKSTKIC